MHCATERGAVHPPNHISTWHNGWCGICRQKKSVTQPRDFGRTRSKLKVDKMILKLRAEQDGEWFEPDQTYYDYLDFFYGLDDGQLDRHTLQQWNEEAGQWEDVTLR